VYLKKYPTTYEQDLDILKEDDEKKTLTRNQRNCVMFRSGEKKILLAYCDHSDRVINLFSLPHKEAMKVVNLNKKEFTNIMEYVTDVVLKEIAEKEGMGL
jgi:hypothetical protein